MSCCEALRIHDRDGLLQEADVVCNRELLIVVRQESGRNKKQMLNLRFDDIFLITAAIREFKQKPE